MAVHYQTQGFVLEKTDLREADQVFSVYTKDFGKLEILGKAIRKIKSKLRAGAELFYLSEIEFIQGKNYKTLTDTITIEKFKNVRNSPEKLEIAYRIAEVADNLIKGQEKDEKIWDLINEVFNRLDNCKLKIENSLKIENCKLKIIYYYFLWNLLSILGYQIDLYNCAVCQKKLLPQKLYFSAEEGIIHFNCFKKTKKGEEISPEAIKILRLFLKNDWQILSRLKIESFCQESLKKISENYLSCYLQKE